MRYTKIPHTTIEVSRICLGTMTWGKQNSKTEAFEQLDYALDQGINFIDTAEMYPIPPHPDRYAHTEKIIGSWLRESGKRDQVVLATKIVGRGESVKHIRTEGFTREVLIEAVEGSLERLQTDYIDLFQLHWPERHTNFFGKRGYRQDVGDFWEDNIHQVLETFRDLIESGKVRHIGLSNETPWGIMRFLEESKVHSSLPRIVTVQNPYNLLNRLYEVGIAEISHREKMGLLAYSPLAFGTLSGKYLGGMKPATSRITLFPQYTRYNGETAIKATAEYHRLAQEHGLSTPQMALAFVLSRPFVTSAIIGATKMDQLKENIASIDVELDDEAFQGIEAIYTGNPDPAP